MVGLAQQLDRPCAPVVPIEIRRNELLSVSELGFAVPTGWERSVPVSGLCQAECVSLRVFEPGDLRPGRRCGASRLRAPRVIRANRPREHATCLSHFGGRAIGKSTVCRGRGLRHHPRHVVGLGEGQSAGTVWFGSILDGAFEARSVLLPNGKYHICIRCGGSFPCWGANCKIVQELVCDDCADGLSEGQTHSTPW